MTARALVALLAGELHQLHPNAYDHQQHPVDPAAVEAAERLLVALAAQGVIVAADEAA
ncbi:hypothetical protein Q3V23_19060 [Streptomyces sp. VNUA116]|uniref:hypothetical protein n=1 Tax=Streptomyces sp. VNUA116 TaxID=3062449 RepID=UPI002676E280|nr:hypothetical protein [Streptomyces sp. VNUA116]WKU45990.1 hypothetical protein Q3V23_19060 [Streptomyces sp. VNUA116]